MKNVFEKSDSLSESKRKARTQYAAYLDKFNNNEAVKSSSFKASYNKKSKFINASSIILMQLIDMANLFKGNIYAKDEYILNNNKGVDQYKGINAYLSDENKITIQHYRKIIRELDRDNIIYCDRTRYYNRTDNGQAVAFTGLISGEHAAINDMLFQYMIETAFSYDDFNAFENDIQSSIILDSISDKASIIDAFNAIKKSNLKSLDLKSIVYNENGFKYIDFEKLALIRPFYDGLKFANLKQWKDSGIYKTELKDKRKDNYIHRHIHLNIDLIADLSATTSINDNTYNKLRTEKKRRLMKFGRRVQITLFRYIVKNITTNSEYITLLNRKRAFNSKYNNELNDNLIEQMLSENIEERKNADADLYIPDVATANRIIKRFIKYMKLKMDNVSEDNAQDIINVIYINAKNELSKKIIENNEEILLKQFTQAFPIMNM